MILLKRKNVVILIIIVVIIAVVIAAVYLANNKSNTANPGGSSTSQNVSSGSSSGTVSRESRSDQASASNSPASSQSIPMDSSYQSTAAGYMGWKNADFTAADEALKDECADIYANEMGYDRSNTEQLQRIFAHNPDKTLKEIIEGKLQ